MKYEDRISRRRKWGLVVGLIGAAVVALVVYILMFFVVRVAISLPRDQESLLVAVVSIIAGFAYLGGIVARTFHTENVDTQIGTMGRIARNVVKAGIEEMNAREARTE